MIKRGVRHIGAGVVCAWMLMGLPFFGQAGDAVTSPESAGWQKVFEDTFDRDELGDDWVVIDGQWEIGEDGFLSGRGTLLSAAGFPREGEPSFQRLSFHAMAEAEAVELMPGVILDPQFSDMSPFIHVKPGTGMPFQTGYFFQFGGHYNTRNRIVKHGEDLLLDEPPKVRIDPERLHHVVVENDLGRLRFYVDGDLVYDIEDEGRPLLGNGHDRVGFYFYTTVRVRDVKVYTKPLP